MSTMIPVVLAIVCLVLYLARRRSRLQVEEE
jgi:hypothetical protein